MITTDIKYIEHEKHGGKPVVYGDEINRMVASSHGHNFTILSLCNELDKCRQ